MLIFATPLNFTTAFVFNLLCLPFDTLCKSHFFVSDTQKERVLLKIRFVDKNCKLSYWK